MSDLAVTGRKLDGRRIIITGAASGIGRATARLFAAHGAKLALVDRTAEVLAQVATELHAEAYPIDLLHETAVNEMVDSAANRFGGLDGIVNAAGISVQKSIADTKTDDWDRLMAINLRAPFLICRQAIRHLLTARAPTIVNVASGTALSPTLSGFSAYASSKGGLVTLSKALAYELAPHIRVNSVNPGATVTGMLPTAAIAAVSAPNSPYALKRTADPLEIANAILFLSSEDSSYVTGIALAVDGGRTFH